jgi:hypothetical protein
MDPKVTPIDATLGAVVTGLALSQMDGSTWKTVPGPSRTRVIRPGKPVGLAGVAATPGAGPVWAVGLALDQYNC